MYDLKKWLAQTFEFRVSKEEFAAKIGLSLEELAVKLGVPLEEENWLKSFGDKLREEPLEGNRR